MIAYHPLINSEKKTGQRPKKSPPNAVETFLLEDDEIAEDEKNLLIYSLQKLFMHIFFTFSIKFVKKNS